MTTAPPAASTTTLHATARPPRRRGRRPATARRRQRHRQHDHTTLDTVDEFATALRQHDGISSHPAPGADSRRARRFPLRRPMTRRRPARPRPRRPRCQRSDHCTVLEIGDSLGNDIGWGLATSTRSRSRTADSCRPTSLRPDSSHRGFYDWPKKEKVLARSVTNRNS